MSTGGNSTRVLAVEDDPTLAKLLEKTLETETFDFQIVGDGETAIKTVPKFRPDVVLLDVVLPGLDGIEVCRKIRSMTDAYIVMVTVKSGELDKIVGLSVGADDYMTKPFSPSELIARIRAMMRRPRRSTEEKEPRTFDGMTIDPMAHTVSIDGERKGLTKLEFSLLDTLSARPNVTFTRSDLLEKVWGAGWVGDDHVVDVHIANLRNKIGDNGRQPKYIQTVRGIGYRLDAES